MKIDKNFKDFAIAFSIINLMKDEKPRKTNEFAKTLNISFSVAKKVVAQMSKANLILAKKGFTSEGFSKANGITVKDVFSFYKIDQSSEDIDLKVNQVFSKKKFKVKTCAVCETEIRFRSETNVCKNCLKYDKPLFLQTRLARCGHPSSDRYFKCRECQPFLSEEGWEEESYSVSI